MRECKIKNLWCDLLPVVKNEKRNMSVILKQKYDGRFVLFDGWNEKKPKLVPKLMIKWFHLGT